MKRLFLILLTLCLVLLTACGARPVETASPAAPEEDAAAPEADNSVEEQTYVSESTLRIVDGAETGHLVLAGEEADEVCTLDVGDTPVYLDGEEAGASALEDGMMVTLELTGDELPESGPVTNVDVIRADSLGSEGNPGGGYYDLCGLYLQVLEDLWSTDPGLNDGISYISVDLTQAPGDLTAGEKAAIVKIFSEAHNAEGLNLTWAQLADQGYLASDTDDSGEDAALWWEDGLLFTISPAEGSEEEAYSLPVVRFDAEKWRSPLGAYFLTDCTAVWPEMGTWNGYTVAGAAIS